MKRSKSPCIDVCQFTGPNKWCLGCGRTIEECKDWKRMKPYEQKILINNLQKRMSQMKENSLQDKKN